MGPLFFNGAWTTFCSVWIVRTYILMIFFIGSSGDTEEELLANDDRDVRAMLDRLPKEELVASVSKTNFFVRSVEVCGHVLDNRTRRPAPGKMLALERQCKPNNVQELRGFLGLANYYSGYVQSYASIPTPLS